MAKLRKVNCFSFFQRITASQSHGRFLRKHTLTKGWAEHQGAGKCEPEAGQILVLVHLW